MKKYLILFVLIIALDGYGQSKKQLQAIIERMKVDSVALMNNFSEKEKALNQNIQKLDLLQSKISDEKVQSKKMETQLNAVLKDNNILKDSIAYYKNEIFILENKLKNDTIQNLKNAMNSVIDSYHYTSEGKRKKIHYYIGAFDYFIEGDLPGCFFKNKYTGQELMIHCGRIDCYECNSGEFYLVTYYEDDVALWDFLGSDETVPVSCALKIIKLE